MNKQQLISTCVHLRHKMMYVDENQSVPGKVDDSSDTTVYWCDCTHDPLGPDDAPIGPRLCQGCRSCYVGRSAAGS